MKEKEGKIMIKKYEGAGVIFWRRGDKGKIEVLLAKRAQDIRHAPGQWSSFGGGRNPNETPWQNAQREAIEESAHGLGWSELPSSYFGIRSRPLKAVSYLLFYQYTYFDVQVIKNPLGWPSLNWEHSEVKWFPVDQLPNPLHSESRKIIRLVAEFNP